MDVQKIPREVKYESSPMSLRELYGRLLLKKQQLEDKGYHCPWLLEDIGNEEPLLLLTNAGLSKDDLIFRIEREDRELGFHVTVSYNPSKKEARCFGGRKVYEDSEIYRLLQSAIDDFNETTGIDLEVKEKVF